MGIDWQHNTLTIQPLFLPIAEEAEVGVHLLRLDALHPEVSGNKWYKLKYLIQDALQTGKQNLLSFGGCYSNHLHALAYAANRYNLKSMGIVRGDNVTNPTLLDCERWGMELHFVSRTDYRRKTEQEFLQGLQQQYPDAYIIPEGGASELAVQGCSEILQQVDTSSYDFILVSVGTGTTYRGLLQAKQEHQQVLGYAAWKQSMPSLENFYFHDEYFGGFGKSNARLQEFMLDFEQQTQVKLDRVYTAKMMYQVCAQIQQGYFKRGSRLLAIHTGGLQGNRSLEKP